MSWLIGRRHRTVRFPFQRREERSPNSAGIVIDAVRLAKLALNNGVSGALEGPSSYLMKSPPKQIVDDEAYAASEAFIEKYKRKAPAKVKKAAKA